MSTQGVHLVEQYQPGGHFWAIQTAESAIFLAVALLLVGVTFVLVRRWRT